MPDHAMLLALVPDAPEWSINWATIWPLWPELAALYACPQDSIHHAESDAGTHTRMVVEALVADPEWRTVPPDKRNCLFWTAILHDIGKPATTRHEDGRITSRGHSRVGAPIARRLLWHAGSPFEWREALCGIIMAHQLPFWLLERDDPTRLAITTSLTCRPSLLCLHAHADVVGRVCSDQRAMLDNVALSRTLFEEAGCLDAPFPFANDESRLEFLERNDRDPHFAAHEDFRCTVTVMSGLPGSGRDRWIARHRPDTLVVSLDAIRQKTGAAATGNQGRVVQAAQEAARVHLRAGTDFIWNATNVTRQVRAKVLLLLRDYGARIEIVYLEVPPTIVIPANAGISLRCDHSTVRVVSKSYCHTAA